jgi:hypothetical protein
MQRPPPPEQNNISLQLIRRRADQVALEQHGPDTAAGQPPRPGKHHPASQRADRLPIRRPVRAAVPGKRGARGSASVLLELPGEGLLPPDAQRRLHRTFIRAAVHRARAARLLRDGRKRAIHLHRPGDGQGQEPEPARRRRGERPFLFRDASPRRGQP